MQSCSFQQNILHRGSIWKRHSHVFVWKRKIKHVCLQCHPLGLIIGTIYLIVSELWCYSISRAEGSWSKLNDQSNVAFSMNRPWINMTLLFSCNGPGFHPESFNMCVSKMSAASWEQRSYKNGQERGHLFIILNSVIIMLQHHIIPMILFVDVCICVCVRQRETYQHSVNVQTPVDRWEVHQVLSCKNLSDTDETSLLLNISLAFSLHSFSSAEYIMLWKQIQNYKNELLYTQKINIVLL